MDKFQEVHTAQELLDFLLSIPQSIREVLPLTFNVDDGQDGGRVDSVQAHLYVNGGNEERGFNFNGTLD